MIFFAFPAVALLLVGIHVWLYRRLCRPLQSPPLKVLGAVLVVLSFAGMGLGHAVYRAFPSPAGAAFQRFGYVAMAFMLYLVLALALADGGGCLVRTARRVLRFGKKRADSAPAPKAPDAGDNAAALGEAAGAGAQSESGRSEEAEVCSRRQFLKVGGLAALGTAAAATGGGAWSAASCRPFEITIPVSGLPGPMAGFSAVLLSDIHAGGWIGRDFVRRLVDQANAMDADAVFICGDLVDGSVPALADIVAPLKDLKSRHGTFFTIGNHELYSGVDQWCAHLPKLGIRVLRNERAALDGIDLLGVDDWTAARAGEVPGYDLDGVLASRRPDAFPLLLTHQPRGFRTAADKGVRLQLSGHTHGGQVFPFQPIAARANEGFLAGLYSHGDARLYVSRGCGYWGPPVRVAAPSEITKIILVPQPPTAA